MDVTADDPVHSGRDDAADQFSVAARSRSFWARSFWARVVLAVAVRPGLWFTAARVGLRSCPPRWWRDPPFIPRPDRAYLRFRFETAFGERGTPQVRDVIGYLRWCRER